VSLDAAEGLCRWQDQQGNHATRPDHPDLKLRTHRWCWNSTVMTALLATERDTGLHRVFLCGMAANQHHYLDRFDLVIMLDIPADAVPCRSRLFALLDPPTSPTASVTHQTKEAHRESSKYQPIGGPVAGDGIYHRGEQSPPDGLTYVSSVLERHG